MTWKDVDGPEDLCGELHHGAIDQLQPQSGLHLVTSVTPDPGLFSTWQPVGAAPLRTIKARGTLGIIDHPGAGETDQVRSERKYFRF